LEPNRNHAALQRHWAFRVSAGLSQKGQAAETQQIDGWKQHSYCHNSTAARQSFGGAAKLSFLAVTAKSKSLGWKVNNIHLPVNYSHSSRRLSGDILAALMLS
jgi:hypothetical protein